jgi:hypothetical protein
MRHALVRTGRCALLCFFAVIAGLASAQVPVSCPAWNLHYGSPNLAAKAYFESQGFIAQVGASCAPAVLTGCTPTVAAQSTYVCVNGHRILIHREARSEFQI